MAYKESLNLSEHFTFTALFSMVSPQRHSWGCTRVQTCNPHVRSEESSLVRNEKESLRETFKRSHHCTKHNVSLWHITLDFSWYKTHSFVKYGCFLLILQLFKLPPGGSTLTTFHFLRDDKVFSPKYFIC